MKKKFIWGVLILSCLLIEFRSINAQPHIRDIYQRTAPAVISVVSFEQQRGKVHFLGSGFVIDPDGWIVSNYHVFKNFLAYNQNTQALEFTHPIKIKNGSDFYDIKSFGHLDSRHDFVILKIVGQFNLPCIRLTDSDKVQIGDEVIAIGNPEGFERSLSTGVISQRRPAPWGSGHMVLQTTAPISSGSSGGPLMNLNGHVIGIITATYSLVPEDPKTDPKVPQNLNFAIPINYVRSVLDDIRATVGDDIRCNADPAHDLDGSWSLQLRNHNVQCTVNISCAGNMLTGKCNCNKWDIHDRAIIGEMRNNDNVQFTIMNYNDNSEMKSIDLQGDLSEGKKNIQGTYIIKFLKKNYEMLEENGTFIMKLEGQTTYRSTVTIPVATTPSPSPVKCGYYDSISGIPCQPKRIYDKCEYKCVKDTKCGHFNFMNQPCFISANNDDCEYRCIQEQKCGSFKGFRDEPCSAIDIVTIDTCEFKCY